MMVENASSKMPDWGPYLTERCEDGDEEISWEKKKRNRSDDEDDGDNNDNNSNNNRKVKNKKGISSLKVDDE
jgi:hypothetical protein